MAFNEDSRVKIPAILHLIRLGFSYIPQYAQIRRENTNIFESIFSESILKLNPHLDESDIKRLLDEITLELDFEDLGRKFFHRLTSGAGLKLIDFQNFSNNSFHITTELTCKNGDEEFRPDITILINGMPSHKIGTIVNAISSSVVIFLIPPPTIRKHKLEVIVE